MNDNASDSKPSPQDTGAVASEPARGGNLRAEVLARMGHELRTPLNAIIGFIRLVEEGLYTTEEERRDYLSSARQSALTLLDLINNILDLARIEAGRLALDSVDFSVLEIMEEVAKTLAPEAHAKGVEIDALVDPAIPARLKSDPLRLRQVLYNLAGNAVKFTDSGIVLLRAELDEARQEDSHVRFTVRDTGIGIPEELQPTIFESFVQTTGPHANRFGGVGLGLSIARQIVEQMGGTIALESRLGSGSTFRFTLALPVAQQSGTRAPTRESPLAGRPVLLLNPDARTAGPMLQKLAALGLEASHVETTEAALARLESAQQGDAPLRAILVDHHLRRDDALVFARRLRREAGWYQPDLLHLTIIGATADAAPLRDAGFTAFLTKPASMESLRAVLTSLMERQSPRGATVPAVAEDVPPPMRTRAGQGRVLVAEDNVVNQKLIHALLSKQGYRTRLVNNGQEALTALREERFDLVLMDVQMPVMDGLTAARSIRELPEGADVPIIAMTADALDGDRERCLAAGMNDHVPKPIMPDVLIRKFGNWLPAAQGVAAAADRGGAEAGDPVLDVAHLDAVLAYAQQHDVAGFAELLDAFRQETRAALHELARAGQSGDRPAVQYAVRRIQLAGAGFGAPRLHALAGNLVRQSATDDPPAVEVLLPKLEAELQGVEAALTARFGGSATQTPRK